MVERESAPEPGAGMPDRDFRPPARLTLAGTKSGILLGAPFAANSCIYGAVFGVLASDSGLTLVEATLMSGLMFSGTAQIASLQVGLALASLLPITMTIAMMNARYLLMGAAVRQIYKGLPARHLALTLGYMGDTCWAVALRENAAGRNDAGIMLGCGLVLNSCWTSFTALGFLAGSLLGDPKRLGLDFMIAAVCTASAATMWERRKADERGEELAAILAAVAAAILAQKILPGAWYIVVAGVVGAFVGGLRHARKT